MYRTRSNPFFAHLSNVKFRTLLSGAFFCAHRLLAKYTIRKMPSSCDFSKGATSTDFHNLYMFV